MPRPLLDSEYLYGFHDPGGERLMLEKGIPGWVLVTEELRYDPNDQRGKDYRALSDQGLGVIVRLNAGYHGVGTIPHETEYANFAKRCANFVRNSPGCRIWIIGNEPNHPIERPGGENGEVITPQRYAKCFRLVRSAIRSVPGHNADQVVVAAVAPWNAQTTYSGNASGDWIIYFRDLLHVLGPDNCDGISIHTYTHGANVNLITSDARMGAPFEHRRYEFRAYRDFMEVVPESMQHLPVYITEANQDGEWLNDNKAWVQRAYGEIDHWNKTNYQKVRALLLYRWPKYDKWYIEGKQGVIDDFRSVLDYRYKWQVGPTTPPLPALRARITPSQTPTECPAASVLELVLLVRNQGAVTWTETGATPFRLVARWRDGSGKSVRGAETIRLPLPKAVKTNEEVRLELAIKAPSTAGAYTLAVDMMQEPDKWFESQGGKPLSLAVKVTAAPSSGEQFFPETNVWVRGAFLEFYNRHGQDLVGLPIAEASVEEDLPSQYFQRLALEQQDAQPVRVKLLGQKALAMAKQITALEAEIAALRQSQGGAGVVRPPLQDITARLPRNAAGLYKRQDSDIRYVIVHHTGVAGRAAVDRVAAIYQQRNYPAIISQFYVDSDGAIYQTNGINEVVSGDLTWAKNGVSILVAGNFSQGVPSDAQMASIAALSAWLLRTYRLDVSAVRGVNEGFARTQSPGTNWLAGLRWKETLLRRVDVLLAGGLPASNETLSQLRQERDRLAGQFEAAQQEIVSLREALERSLEAPSGVIPQPAMRDVTTTLSRDPSKLVLRTSADVRYVVINHSGVPVEIGPDRIAEAHRRYWPAFIGHYWIAADGEILQTNPLETAVEGKQDWLFRAVNIFVAGSFDTDVPTAAQIASLGNLVAWLQQQYRLDDNSVKGVSEFIVSRSPGEQWTEGKNWKQMLMERVAAVRKAAPPSTGPDAATTALLESLRKQLTEAQTRNRELESLVADLQKQIADLKAQPTGPGDAPSGALPKPAMLELVDALLRHQSLTYETRTLDQITHVAIHHSAAPASITPQRIAEYHVSTHGWPGIGYHYYIGADGVIHHTQDLSLISHHVYKNNSYAVGVCLAGDFTDVGPTPPQLEAAGRLVAWLMQDLRIPVTNVWGHREFPENMTACPGRQWLEGQQWKQALMAAITAAGGQTAATPSWLQPLPVSGNGSRYNIP